MTPFVTSSGSSQAGIWTPDGKHIVYRGTRNGFRNLFWKSADGTGEEERLTTKENVNQTPEFVSADGRWLIFSEEGVTGSDILMLPLGGDRPSTRTPEPLVRTPA